MSSEEKGEKSEVELDETACNDLQVASLSDLPTHLLENTAISTSLFLHC